MTTHFRHDAHGKQRGLDWSHPDHGGLANPVDPIVDTPNEQAKVNGGWTS